MSIKYQTTRGAIKGASFQQALLSGFAPDGGLFVPESLPRFTRDEIRSWVGLSYPQLVEKLMRFFIAPEELSSQEIHGASEFISILWVGLREGGGWGGTVVAKGCGKRSCIIEPRPSSKEEGSRLCNSMWNNHPLSLVEATTPCAGRVLVLQAILYSFLWK